MAERRMEVVDEALGLWSAELVNSARFSIRTTILRLRDNSLALFSPTRGLEDAIAELGEPSVLVAPNHFHHLGLGPYLERWPEAKVLATRAASKRLAKKSCVSDFGELSELRALLPEQAEVLEPPGLKSGELLLRVETSEGIAWAVSDAFFNMAQNPKGLTGLVCRATRTSPGLKLGRTFTLLAVSDKQAYRAWLRAQLDGDKPSILMPGHGEIFRGAALYDALDRETRQRLGA